MFEAINTKNVVYGMIVQAKHKKKSTHKKKQSKKKDNITTHYVHGEMTSIKHLR